KQRQATVIPAASGGGALEIGMEEIGFEPPPRAFEAQPEAEPGPEPAPPPPPEPAPSPRAVEPTPPAPSVRTPPPPPAAAAPPAVDQERFTGEFESVEPLLEVEPSAEPEPEPQPEPAVSPDPMTDSLFADELLSVLENAFQESPAAEASSPGAPPAAGAQIVVSPLFKDFSVEELVAVIGGLNLMTFERGQVILRDGEPGNRLYMLTSGSVKAFVKREGKQVPVAELEEGAFFGEVSILSGKPLTATVVAKEHCEL